MNEIETEIKALKIRVNILLAMGVLSFILTIVKLLMPSFSHVPTTTPAADYRILPQTTEESETAQK